jgi:hypothetical protein
MVAIADATRSNLLNDIAVSTASPLLTGAAAIAHVAIQLAFA